MIQLLKELMMSRTPQTIDEHFEQSEKRQKKKLQEWFKSSGIPTTVNKYKIKWKKVGSLKIKFVSGGHVQKK